jgi:hypothetical protein
MTVADVEAALGLLLPVSDEGVSEREGAEKHRAVGVVQETIQ